jgi:hypothetical protein
MTRRPMGSRDTIWHRATGARAVLFLVAPVVLTLVAAACSSASSPASRVASPAAPSSAAPAPAGVAGWPASVPDAWLVVGRAGSPTVDVVRASTAQPMIHFPAVVADDRWTSLVSATSLSSKTFIRRLEADNGFEADPIALDGTWRLPTIGSDPSSVGLSADRSIVALVPATASAAGASTGVSRFAIVDLANRRLSKVISLKGAFAFDAISPDGSTLYVVEHLDAAAGGRYQVRAVDVRNGALKDGVIIDKTKPNEQMAGYPIEQLRLAHGLVLTLYRGTEHAFIHALDTVSGGAVCIDLPATRDDRSERSDDWGMALSPDRSSVYAVNASLGVAAVVDAEKLEIRHVASFEPRAASAMLAKFGHDGADTARRVAVSPDGGSVYAAGRTGIVELAATDLAVRRTVLAGTRVDALGLTVDGTGLFALRHSDGRIVRVDLATGAVVAEVPGAGYDRLLAVAPW